MKLGNRLFIILLLLLLLLVLLLLLLLLLFKNVFVKLSFCLEYSLSNTLLMKGIRKDETLVSVPDPSFLSFLYEKFLINAG